MRIDEGKLIKYLIGTADAKEKEMIKEQLEYDSDLQAEYQCLSKIWSELDHVPLSEPRSQVQNRFEQWLSAEIAVTKKPKIRQIKYWQYAAAVIVFGAIFFTVLDNQPSQMQEETKALGSDDLVWTSAESTTARIKGIYQIEARASDNDELVPVLLNLLHRDESPNVRLKALEALQSFPVTDQIKTGLIKALRIEKKPVVQIALITALVDLKDVNAKSELQILVNDEQIEPFVKDEAHLGLLRL